MQRLCKTSVKKNLYWTVKDKVIEESFDGIRNIKKKARVKVYGTDSTPDVRNRLIEILRERVEYHKDKVIAPILLSEMRAMEVKKNGKVEHSSTTHDDQVFSWLMALYVWYDGENLADRFHIYKNTLKTDEEEELFDSDLDEALNPKETISLDKFQDADDAHSEEIIAAYQFIEDNKPIITTSQFKDSITLQDAEQRTLLLSVDKNAKKAYCALYGIDPDTIGETSASVTMQLPDYLFNLDDNTGFDGNDFTDPNYQLNNPNNEYHKPLVGNLSSYWDQV